MLGLFRFLGHFYIHFTLKLLPLNLRLIIAINDLIYPKRVTSSIATYMHTVAQGGILIFYWLRLSKIMSGTRS